MRMATLSEFKPGIHYVGVNDRTTHLFEALWSLPYGVSYNSYLITDTKTALIDTVEEGFGNQFLTGIAAVLGDRPLDFLIVNHMEPDHSGSILSLRRIYPDMKIVGNAKTIQMITGYYGIKEGLVTIKEGDEIALGAHTLRFYLTPMLHWPETMMTYCPEEKLLFTGDAFGSFGALNGGVLDAQLTLDHFWDEMRRYYACIVSKYGRPVQQALQKLQGVAIETLCSTHGPIWQQETGKVIALYEAMSRHYGESGVVIAYASMYGNTAQAAEALARALAERGVKPIIVHNLSVSDPSIVLRDIHKYKALVIGSPTYNGDLFPEVSTLLQRISSRCLAPRIFGCFGSFTWAGTAVRHLKTFAEEMKWELAGDPIEFKQGYNASCNNQEAALAQAIAEKLK